MGGYSRPLWVSLSSPPPFFSLDIGRFSKQNSRSSSSTHFLCRVVWCMFEISPNSWPILTQCSNIKGHLVTDSSIPSLRTPSNSGESHLTAFLWLPYISVSATRSIEIFGHFQACKLDVFSANWMFGFDVALSSGMFSWVFSTFITGSHSKMDHQFLNATQQWSL